MASHDPRHTKHARRSRNLTGHGELAPRIFLRAPLGLLLAVGPLLLLLLLTSPYNYAQSGRNKQPTGKPTSSGTTRPKRTGANSGSQQQPQPTPTPVMRVPNGVIVMDEAPPPAPIPKPTPTPAEDTSAGDEVGAEDVVRISSNLVTVPASVVDSQGRAVVNLQLEDFELRVDGQPRPISELSRAEVPVTLALLFDNSQSLSAAREFEKQAAIRFFRTVIRPIDRAAIYAVATDIILAQPLTNNIPALVKTIERFGKPEGATRLHDAIAEAAAYLRPYPGRKVIVIVSDGEDTLSDLDFDKMLRKTLAADCQVYAVQTKQIEYMMLTGQASNANLQALAAERRMQDLTSQTGGAIYAPFQVSDLESAFTQIAADLAQQYILSYYPTDERQDGLFRTISVRVATRQNMRVRARRGYYPRRTGEKFSFNTQAPPANLQLAGAGNSLQKENSFQTDSVPALASNITQPEKRSELPVRSGRMGPSETSDIPDAGSEVKTALIEQPVVRREAGANKISEPVAQPKPIVVSATSPTAANDRPPAATSSPTVVPKSPPATSPPTVPVKPVSGGVLNGKAVHLPKPQYPANARRIRAFGVVTVEVMLDEEGRVTSAHAVDGNISLRQSAVAAALLARFTPTILSGKPVKVAGIITYKFSLAE